jgi:hypothetical protein
MPEKSESLAFARFRAMLEEALFPAPSSVELVRTAYNDYVLRFGAKQPHIAELFQENTKLGPSSNLITPTAEADLKEARKWYFTTPYRPRDGDVDPERSQTVRLRHDELTPSLRAVLAPFALEGATADLLFSVDLFVLQGHRLFRQLPQADFLWSDLTLMPAQLQMLRTSLLGLEPAVVKETRTWLLLAGAPWRYMMFYGPRGYRRMMFDIGALVARLYDSAENLDLRPAVCYDFFDTRLNQVFQLDGTERTILALMAVPGIPA